MIELEKSIVLRNGKVYEIEDIEPVLCLRHMDLLNNVTLTLQNGGRKNGDQSGEL
jgi:hypothetical protein